MTEPFRVLVTASRTWPSYDVIAVVLDEVLRFDVPAGHYMVLRHGAAGRGGDRFADMWAARHDVETKQVPADWERYGKPAGMIRNAEMVAAGADLCLAFIRDGSRGATHCASLAQAAGIPTRIFQWEDPS